MLGGVRSRLLGFDVRQAPGARWSADRRAQFLLRPELMAPLSVDEGVWPSAVPETTSWRGGPQNLWSHLASLPRAEWTLAVAQVCFEGTPSPFTTDETTPTQLDESWTLLGYDVADTWLLSGLSNCGYHTDEVAPLRGTWGPRLNDHHLFGQLDDARAFAALSGRRVSAHAPFFVFALWKR
jgi:hypothetical protein